VIASIDSICQVIQGQSPPGDTYNSEGDGLPFFQGKAEFGPLYPIAVKWCRAPAKIADVDDVLLSVRAPVGPTNLANVRCCIGRGLAAIHSPKEISTRYVLYALRASASSLRSQATGSTFEAVSGDAVRNHAIALAPGPEQRRVVAELEKQFTRLDAAVTALKRVKANLKRYRTAVLKTAGEGHEGSAKVSEILAEPLINGRSVPDRGGGFPVLRLTCLRNGRIDFSETKEGAWTASEARRFLVHEGDFLIARGNGSIRLVGRGGLVDRVDREVAFPDTLIRLRVDLRRISQRFLGIVWAAPRIRNQIESVARTTAGIFKINQHDIESIRLPIPSLEEQHRIVEEVERRLSVVDELEATVEKNLARCARLRQAIFKLAFEGRLVPQDPNDEPASVLLDRIRKERETVAAAGPNRKRQKAARA
jgi:type I restriction enzyme S subunit